MVFLGSAVLTHMSGDLVLADLAWSWLGWLGDLVLLHMSVLSKRLAQACSHGSKSTGKNVPGPSIKT